MVDADGLLIKSVERGDSGTYTCRARVPQTGELEERDIQLQVGFEGLFFIPLLKYSNVGCNPRFFKTSTCLYRSFAACFPGTLN